MTDYKIAVLPGDGIGEEVMTQALRVLQAILDKSGHRLQANKGLIGGAAYEQHEQHFPQETQDLCADSQAILFGSVGGPLTEMHLPKWHDCEKNSILSLRKTFSLNANLRPARVYPQLTAICPLKDALIKDGIDILIVRELIGDIYFGEHKRFIADGKRCASDVAFYDEQQISNVLHTAFQAASKRGKRLTSVDKANVLDTSKLWREIADEVAKEYPEVSIQHMLVDNCAMQLIVNPAQFDVIVTANLFGDILSDAAATLPGSLGLMPSASLSLDGFGLYEPSGGSAPDLAGHNVANPIAQILSAAMMLKFSFGLVDESQAIERAVEKTLVQGFRTKDIFNNGEQLVGTVEMTDKIISNI